MLPLQKSPYTQTNELDQKSEKSIPKISPMTMKVASFFAGCGGLDYAFHHNEKFEVVFSNDFDDRACETYEHNFKFKLSVRIFARLTIFLTAM